MEFLSSRQLLEQFDEELIRHIDEGWGHWHYSQRNNTLQFVEDGRWLYEVDMDLCVTDEQFASWVRQIAGKAFIDTVDVGIFVKFAIDLMTANA